MRLHACDYVCENVGNPLLMSRALDSASACEASKVDSLGMYMILLNIYVSYPKQTISVINSANG